MIDLRELMEERSAGCGISADARLAEVRHKISVRRRRRTVGLAGAAVLVTALAAYVAVPDGPPARPDPSFGPATVSASTPAPPTPHAGRKIGPFDEYASGYQVIAIGQAPVSAKKIQLSWKVNAPEVRVYTYCPGLPGEDAWLQGEFRINGAPQFASLSCGSQLMQDGPTDQRGIRWDVLSVGVTVTATFTLTDSAHLPGISPDIPEQGTMFVAVAEKVPSTDYPLPPRPARLTPPQPDDMAGEPGTKVVHSDPADPNKPVTTTLTWHRSHEFRFVHADAGHLRGRGQRCAHADRQRPRLLRSRPTPVLRSHSGRPRPVRASRAGVREGR